MGDAPGQRAATMDANKGRNLAEPGLFGRRNVALQNVVSAVPGSRQA
jgi:hypothetical protein